MVRYRPPAAISSSWVPSSTARPPSSTQMRSAWRTVENRCEMRIVVVCRVAARMRSKISASPRHVKLCRGLVEEHQAGALKDRTERSRKGHALPLAAG